MEYIVTYEDEDGIQHVAHVTNAYAKPDGLTPAQMVQASVGGKIKVVSVEGAGICVPKLVMSFPA